MAQSANTGANGVAFTSAAASRGYDVHDGNVLIGAAPETGDGFILTVPANSNLAASFDSVPETHRGMLVQAVLEYMQNRIAQPAAKAKDATKDSVQAAVTKACAEGFKPSRERDKSVVDGEVDRQHEALLRSQIAAKYPDASEADILTTIANHFKPEHKVGAETRAKLRAAIIAKGTYSPARKGKSTGGTTLEI